MGNETAQQNVPSQFVFIQEFYLGFGDTPRSWTIFIFIYIAIN